MTNSQEPEGSYYSTTSYSYELDFVQDDFYSPTTRWFSLPLRIVKWVLLTIKLVCFSTLRISWESLKFSGCYALFVQKRLVTFVYTLEDLKDIIVRILMWRRGFLFRPTTHGGLLVLASLALIVGSLFRTGVATEDFTRDQVLAAANTPETLITEGRPRSEIVKYTVKRYYLKDRFYLQSLGGYNQMGKRLNKC